MIILFLQISNSSKAEQTFMSQKWKGILFPQVNSAQMGLQVQCIYDNGAEYSKFEMLLNIHMVIILVFPGVIFSLLMPTTAFLGSAKHLKSIFQETFSF